MGKRFRFWQRRCLAFFVAVLVIGQFGILSQAADAGQSTAAVAVETSAQRKQAQSSQDIKELTRWCWGFIAVVMVPFLIWEYRRVSRAKQVLRSHREKCPETGSER